MKIEWQGIERCDTLSMSMDSRMMNKGKHYTWIVRCVAAMAMLFFLVTSFTASLHHHGNRLYSSSLQAVVTGHSHAEAITSTANHSDLTLSAADCLLCDWLMTGSAPGTIVTWAVTVAFSLMAALIFQVRLAALCSRPAPRRGLRAPPLACMA